MDKLMDNPWFIKILALLLAILLFSAVGQQSNKSTAENVPSGTSTETLNDIPVKGYYDTENLVVTGIPSTVSIALSGPTLHVQNAKALRNFEVYVDLTNAKIGKQRVKLKVKYLSDKIKATIKPAKITVNVQEKITQEFKVDAEYSNGMFAEGYSAGTPMVEPNTVKITGAKDIIDRIAYVKASIEEKGPVKETISREERVRVLDRAMNKLDVTVEPSYVKVTIPVKNTSKTVPINIITKGTLPSGINIDSITLDKAEATIIGDEQAIKATDAVRVEVDTSKITDNTTLTLPVIVPTGITKVTPEIVKATVTVNKTAEKNVTGIPVKIKGLADTYSAVWNDPASKTINLKVTGPSSSVKNLTPDDFNVFIDLSNLNPGSYDTDIHVEGPPEVKWKLDKATANITIDNA
jgi:YbbR domain-containing protein